MPHRLRIKVWRLYMKAKLKIATTHLDRYTGEVEKILLEHDADVVVKKNLITVRYKQERIGKIIKIYSSSIETFNLDKNRNLMTFKEKQHCSCRYITPYGFFLMDIFTKSLKVDKKCDTDEIHAQIVYTITDKNFFDSEVNMEIVLTNYA